VKYTIDEISIGDEITFRSDNPEQNDFDEYWTVHGKENENLLIHLEHCGQKYYWLVNIKDVITRISMKNNK